MTIRGPYEIVHYFVGLSTDTKPTSTAVLGDRFFESDTRLWYIYDGSTWSMLNEEFSLSLYGKCSSTMTASTTELVVPTLVGYGNDFFNNKFYIQILKNANSVGNAPEIQVRKITDYVSTSGTFTVDAFGANVEASDEIVVLHESLVAIGRDDSDNVYASTNVGANADGSMLERLEWIQAALGSAAGQLRTVFSASDTVEENAIQFFNIGIFDIDAGAITLANINITSISAVMEKSTGGGAFSSVGITQPTFSKANGSVYCSYQFLAAEWATGDTYKLVVDGITVTIHSTTGYVPTGVWSNVVVETGDIKNDVQYLYAVADGGTTSPTQVVDNSILSILMTKDSGGDVSDFDNSTDSLEAQSDKLGAFTGDGGTDQGDSVKANQDIIISEIDHLYAVADGTGVYPASAVDDSIIAKVLGKGATASASTYDNQTDSLEMLSDKLGAFSGDGGAEQDDSIKASLDLAHTEIANISTTGVTSAPVANTLADILHKDGSFTYDNTTDSLEAISDAIVSGSYTVTADSGTSTTVVDATYTQADNYWNGSLLVCVSGTNAGQARPVVDFANSTGTFTVYPAFNEAVVATDSFLLISGWKFAEWIVMPDVAITDTATTTEADAILLELATAGQSYKVNSARLKFADPGVNTVTVNLYELINDVSTVVDTFTVTTDNYGAYFSLFDMFGVSCLSGDNVKITAVMDAGTCAVTGQYSYEKAYSA